MAAYVTLYLADGSSVRVDLPEGDETGAFYRLLNREGEYATGWLTHLGYEINLAAVVKVEPRGF